MLKSAVALFVAFAAVTVFIVQNPTGHRPFFGCIIAAVAVLYALGLWIPALRVFLHKIVTWYYR